MKISIIGIGRMGGALALALSAKGFEISQLISRNSTNAQQISQTIKLKPEILSLTQLDKIFADVVLIAVPDQAIQMIAEQLSKYLKSRPQVFHVSGSLSSEVLESLRNIDCQVGSIHPLISVSDPVSGARRFENGFFCIEGDSQAVETANEIVKKLNGNAFSIPTEFKTLYHASAVMASGHLTALFSVAIDALTACGLCQTEAQQVLFPLVKSTVENLASQTPAAALTGTFARADVETMNRHLETLRQNVSSETLKIYQSLGLQSIRLAENQGADAEKLSEMKRGLENIEDTIS